ncbi:phage tail protein [Escherichia coli]|uniref:phage tail protein n=1 Tax=Escherichia coli TaxID=562 RepID=UPI002248670E|nr:phage tail protein [Escherichia coli]MCX2207483.1 phage tail protein [Escherichia coli]
MSTKFKTVITTAGAAKLAAATAPGGRKVNITTMAVGDGGGKLPVPDAGQTGLIHEVWRHTLNKISQDKRNSNYIIAELVIPPEVGGFWMRELGLYDDAGTLIAVANMAESYKPALAEGSGRSQTCRMVIIVSSVASVELTIDTTTVMATQDYVDDKIAEHEQSRRHPDASLTAKGFTQLSSATNSTSETLAATPKAVKAAYDLANGKYTAQDATIARKGLVQLSSATNSDSEMLAATSKAVKSANDNAEKRLQKDQNGADIPDKERFLSNINVYSKGEVDKKKGMRKYSFAAPANVVAGKWYPVIFRRAASLSGEMASRVVISTGCYNSDYVMNNCEFNGMVMPGGWTDRGSYAAGYFWTYQTNERSIHSIVTSLKDDDVCSVFYVEARAFPVQILAEEGLTVIVPTEDYVVGQTTYKWGATNPATESTNAQAILDFKNGRGYYCSHPFISSLSGNAATATKLANARNINGVRFDGSADININTLVSRNRVTALGGSVKGTPGIQMYEAYNNGYPTAYGNVLHLTGVTAVGEGELLIGWSGTSGAHAPAYIRSRRDTTDANWSGWAQLYTTAHKPSAGDVGAYTKAESDSRYVRDMRLGGASTYKPANNGTTWTHQAPSGCVYTGIIVQDTGSNSADNIGGVYYRPVQKYINGTWYNVAQV